MHGTVVAGQTRRMANRLKVTTTTGSDVSFLSGIILNSVNLPNVTLQLYTVYAVTAFHVHWWSAVGG